MSKCFDKPFSSRPIGHLLVYINSSTSFYAGSCNYPWSLDNNKDFSNS